MVSATFRIYCMKTRKLFFYNSSAYYNYLRYELVLFVSIYEKGALPKSKLSL